MLRTLTALVVLAASATLAGCAAATGTGGDPGATTPGLDDDGNEDDSSLTAVGSQRAHALVGLFDPAQGEPRDGLARPQQIYAAGVTDDGAGQRTRETVAPLGSALGIPVDTDLGRGDEKKLVKDVLEQSGATLISCQHSGIPTIVDDFPSVSPAPPTQWPDDRFDVVWTLTRTTDGWHFTQTPQLVLPQDSAGVSSKLADPGSWSSMLGARPRDHCGSTAPGTAAPPRVAGEAPL